MGVLKREFHPRIGGRWDVTDESTELGVWNRDCYTIRNRIIHGGYNPTHDDGSLAIGSANQAIIKILDMTSAKEKKYPKVLEYIRKKNKNAAQQHLYAMPFGTLRIAKPWRAFDKTDLRQTINISIFGLFVILMSCKRKSAEQSVSNNKEEFKFPVIVDTSGFKTSKREATWLSTANYELLYIGEWKDDLSRLQFKVLSNSTPPPPPPYGGRLEPSDTIGYHKRLTEHKMYPYYID